MRRPADRADQPSEGGVAPELKRHCGLSDGNLSRHVKLLQDSGLVAVVKGYEDNRPHTAAMIRPTGYDVPSNSPKRVIDRGSVPWRWPVELTAIIQA